MKHMPWVGDCVCKTCCEDDSIITWEFSIEEQLKKSELLADYLIKEIDKHIDNKINYHENDDDNNIVKMDDMMDDGGNVNFDND